MGASWGPLKGEPGLGGPANPPYEAVPLLSTLEKASKSPAPPLKTHPSVSPPQTQHWNVFHLLLPPKLSPTSALKDTHPFTDGGCRPESLWDKPQAANLSRKDAISHREGRHCSSSAAAPHHLLPRKG